MKPVKPKKPKTYKGPPLKCGCNKGKVKEWDNNIYPDYEWVICGCCEGTGLISPEQHNEGLKRTYESAIKEYEWKLRRYKILKTIKLTEEQFDCLCSYGVGEFKKDYLCK